MRLLVGREDVDHAIDGLRGSVRVERTHDENTHLGRGHGNADGFVVAQLTDEHDVRILAQARLQRGRESLGVHADLALADQALLAPVHELDRVFDREDVTLHARIDVVDHRRERRRFPRAGLAGDEDESVVRAAERVDGRRQVELFQRQRFRRDRAHHRAHAVQLPHDVHAETAVFPHVVGEVGAVVILESLHRGLRHDLVQRLLNEILFESVGSQRLQVAVEADARRIAREEVKVGTLLLEDHLQIFVDDRHQSDLGLTTAGRGRRAGDLELRHERRVGASNAGTGGGRSRT